MVRQKQERRWLGEFDGSDPRTHTFDGKTQATSEDVREVGHVSLHVTARVIDEVERRESHRNQPFD
jgi:hypothetical protein